MGQKELMLFSELNPSVQERALAEYISFCGIVTDTGDGRHGDCVTRDDVRSALLAQTDKDGSDWLYHEDGKLVTDDKEYP